MTTQYLTPIPQDSYQSVGLISAAVGFFLLAYFFMYPSHQVATRAPTSPAHSLSKSSSQSWQPQQ